MNNLEDMVIFRFRGIELDLPGLGLLVLLVFAGIFVSRFLVRMIRNISRKNDLPKSFSRFLRQGSWLLVWTSVFLLLLQILHINTSTVLNYELYSNDEFKFRIFNFLVILAILYLVRLFLFAIEYWFDKRIENKKLDRGRGKSFLQIVKYIIWIIGIIVLVGSLGFQITLIIASVSALLVGIGFGLQHIFNDFFSGIIILFDGSIEADDVVEVEGVVGRVLEIGLRVSKVLTRDNLVIIVPNSRFTGQQVINWSHNAEATRFHVAVGVAYGSDVRLVERILLDAAVTHSKIEKNPKPFVRFSDFGDSSLDFELYFWTVDEFLVENIKSDLRFIIDDQFRKNNIVIPFPQRDLHLKTKD